MQTAFKRHQKVRLLRDPDPEYTEYYTEDETPILAGAIGEINILLPNGQYHVKIIGKNGEDIAYIVMDEEGLEKI